MRHLQEFILEEAKLAPSNNEIEQFIQVLQQTVEKTERIEALLTRAKQHPRFRENAP
jgi:ubiquinone biosynthesis protein UbiJ